MPSTPTEPRRLAGRPGHNAGQKFHPEPLSADEVNRLCATFTGRALGDRNRALVAVLYRAGLRLSEALALRPPDVDSSASTITVKKGKGGKHRVVGIDAIGLLAVERWMAHRKVKGIPATAPLFCKMDGTPWAPTAVREVLKAAASRAGITKRVHPHGLRHSHAVRLDEAGARVSAISRQLGHSSIATTSVYLDHISPGDLVAAVASAQFDPPPATTDEPAA